MNKKLKYPNKAHGNYTNEQYIQICKEKHNNFYSYELTKYERSSDFVWITCPIHGPFKMKAGTHMRGGNCRKCSYKKNKRTQDQWIKLCQEKHKNSDGTPKYDYSKITPYNNCDDLIKNIICPIHGPFQKRADMHLFGEGCPKCGVNHMSNEQYIEKAKKIHPNYDYSITNFIGLEYNIDFICPKHGKQTQNAKIHINYQESGCQCCSNENKASNKEIELRNFLTENNVDFIISDRTILLNNQELDIYIPEKNMAPSVAKHINGLAIEFNGLYWHSELYKSKNYHYQKTIDCEEENIQLIHIFEDEWCWKKDIVKARLLNLLGKNKFKIGARKCKIKQVPIEEERVFLQNNHLQGYVASTVCYGLYWLSSVNQKEYLVALMSFGPLRKNLGSSNKEGHYELYRFVTAKNFSVPGGASRLFKHFVKKFNPKQVVSFADRRWSTRIKNKDSQVHLTKLNLYEQLGFKFDSYTEPGYFYIKNNKRENRFNFRKDILIKEYGCPENMTEQQFCLEHKWYRIYDCGQLKYIWNSK